MRLVHAEQLVGDLARAAEDVHPARRDLRLDEPAVEPPERARREHVAQRVVARRRARRPRCRARRRASAAKKSRDERDRLLQVGGHHRDVVALRRGEPGADRAERAEVARQRDQLRREARAPRRAAGAARSSDASGEPSTTNTTSSGAVELAGEPVEARRRARRASARSCRRGRRPSRAAASSARRATRARRRRRRQRLTQHLADPVDLVVGQLGEARQRQHVLARVLGDRQAHVGVVGAPGGLAVVGDRVVDVGRDRRAVERGGARASAPRPRATARCAT